MADIEGSKTPVADEAEAYLRNLSQPEPTTGEGASTIEDRYRVAGDAEEKRRLGQELAEQVVKEARRAKKWWVEQNIPLLAERPGVRFFHYDSTDENGKPLRLVVHQTIFHETASLSVVEWEPDQMDPNRLNVGAERGTTGYDFLAAGEDVGIGISVGRRDQEMVNVHAPTKFSIARTLDFWANTDFARHRGTSHPLQEAVRTNNLLEKAQLIGEDMDIHTYDARGNRTVSLVPVIRPNFPSQ